jgi:hypothetical protein
VPLVTLLLLHFSYHWKALDEKSALSWLHNVCTDGGQASGYETILSLKIHLNQNSKY